MAPVHITFDGLTLPERVRSGIRSALLRIPTTGTGSWPGGVTRIQVTELLQDGLSGLPAIVLAVVHRGSQRLKRVVKCGPAHQLAGEWLAYEELVKPFRNVTCAAIEAASPGAVDPARVVPGEFECVVYDHVAQHAGEPDRDAVMLREVARAAWRGEPGQVDRAVRVVDTLLRRAYEALYNRHETVSARDLGEENPTLGPDLVLEVDRFDDSGRLCLGTPSAEEYTSAVHYPGEVFHGSLAGAGPAVDAMIAVNGLAPGVYGGVLVASRENVSLEIRPVVGSPAEQRWSEAAARPTMDVYGRVVETRRAARWTRLRACFGGDLRTAPHGIAAEGVVTADPFEPLKHVLTDGSIGRTRAVVHGDLNVRNVLVVEDQPYLIDYARTASDRPLLADFAWLEVGLMRDAFSAGPYRRHVHVQRLLALASRLLDTGPMDAEDIRNACLDLAEDEPERAAFRVLFALRSKARQCCQATDEPDWWPIYLAQLVVAAHRSLKWPDALQGEGAIPAATAVAAVAAEWVGATRPFRHWPDDLLDAAMRRVAPLLAVESSDAAVGLASQLVSELDSRGAADAHEALVADLRRRTVRHRFAEYAEYAAGIMAEFGADRQELIELTAREVRWWRDGPEVGAPAASVLPLVAEATELTLLGEPGAGKTTVAGELSYHLAAALAVRDIGQSGRVPVPVRADDLAAWLSGEVSGDPLSRALEPLGPVSAGLLTVGAVHLIVDGLDGLTPVDRQAVSAWLRGVRARLPRAPVLVCHRLRGYDPDLLGFPAVLLERLSPGQIVDHVFRLVSLDRLSPIAARMVLDFAWERDLASRPNWQPLLLGTLIEVARRGTVPQGIGALYDESARRTLTPVQDEAALFTGLEHVARSILDIGHAAGTVPPELRDELLSLGLLRSTDAGLVFVSSFHRDYFGARALLAMAGSEPGELRRRAARAEWREPGEIMVSLPAASERSVELLIDAVTATDPKLAGQWERQRVRAPVGHTGVDAAELHSVATDGAAGDEARIEAIRSLAAIGDRGHPALARQRDTGLLRSALRHALGDGVPEAVRAFAARTIGQHGLNNFDLQLAELIDPVRAWPVCREAMSALRAMGTVLPQQIVDRYQRSCEGRLLDLERRLPGLVTGREVREVQLERGRLLGELADAAHFGWLLDRRLDFEVGDSVADLLDAMRAVPVPELRRYAAGRILTDDAPARDWVRMATGRWQAESVAAVHRLLRDAPGQAGQLLGGAGDDPSRNRLLVAAAVVPYLDDRDLDRAEALFSKAVAKARLDQLEGLSAMLCAIHVKDRGRGVRLAWTGARALTARGLPERLRWPWQEALRRTRGSLADLDGLLRTDADLAITALASFDFHRDAGPAPDHRFSAEAAGIVLSRRPSDGEDTTRWALAATTMSIVDALPAMLRLAGDRALGLVAYPVATNRYGLLEYAPLAELLTAIGYLARVAGPPAATDAHRLLAGLDTDGVHPSVWTGRLVGLAYLGDVDPLLAENGAGDPVIADAARNAVAYWSPDLGDG